MRVGGKHKAPSKGTGFWEDSKKGGQKMGRCEKNSLKWTSLQSFPSLLTRGTGGQAHLASHKRASVGRHVHTHANTHTHTHTQTHTSESQPDLASWAHLSCVIRTFVKMNLRAL